MKRLLGKFAVVAGGSSGIGAACAEAMASEGAGVLATGRRYDNGQIPPPTLGRVTRAQLDVTDEAAVDRVISAMPEVDILVYSAGVGTFGPAINATTSSVRAMLEVHVLGLLNCARAALRRMGFAADEMTAHGFRSLASTLLNESGKWHPDAIERALAHRDTDKVRGTYHRGAHWEERVSMAAWWGERLDVLRAGGDVVLLEQKWGT